MATMTVTTTTRAASTSSRLWTLHPRSTRLQTVHALLAAYSELTPEALLAQLDPSFTHQVLPTSLCMPPRDLTAFADHAGHITKIFSAFAMIPIRIIEDARRNEVVVYADMIGTLAFADLTAEEREWRNECVLFLSMSSDGGKVVEMKEFVDSVKARELRGALEGRVGKRGEFGNGREIVREEIPIAAVGAVNAGKDEMALEVDVEAKLEMQELGFKTVNIVLAGHWRES